MTYQVKARRSGDWWALEVPEVPGVYSQTKRLDQAEAVAREAIAVMLDTEPDDIEVAIDAEIPDDAREALKHVEQAKKATEAAAEAEKEAMQRAASILTRDLSQRDASRFLGVSFQRVSQLLNTKSTTRAKRGKAGQRTTARKAGAGSTIRVTRPRERHSSRRTAA